MCPLRQASCDSVDRLNANYSVIDGRHSQWADNKHPAEIILVGIWS